MMNPMMMMQMMGQMNPQMMQMMQQQMVLQLFYSFENFYFRVVMPWQIL